MKLRLRSAWNCLRGNPTIYNVHFTAPVKLSIDNQQLYIGSCEIDQGGIDIGGTLNQRAPAGRLPSHPENPDRETANERS